MKHAILLGIFFVPYQCLAFENSTDICQKCTCEESTSQFILNCDGQDFSEALATWPDNGGKSIAASFKSNNMATLGLLPSSEDVIDLVFSHCDIKNIENGAFKNVRYVESIDLSYNLLTAEEVAPEKFKGPYNNTVYEPLQVKYLNLAYNQIHSLQHNLFEHMIDLIELNLEGNQLRILDHPTRMALSVLSKLEVLNIANNILTELDEEGLTNLTSLKRLNLARNDLDSVPETLPVVGTHLEVLVLDDNPIMEINENDFVSLPALKELSLNCLERIDYIRPNAFAPLTNLKVLRMSNNERLKDIAAEAFAPNQTLEELYLSNNSLTALEVNLVDWSKLRVFRIEENPLQCTCTLFNISRKLNETITRNLDGPVCARIPDGVPESAFQTDESACARVTSRRTMHAERHFHIMRTMLIVFSSLMVLVGLASVTVAVLRYRRHKTNLSYPFASQVSYNPLNTFGQPQ